jgi:hypothetical protein
MKRITSILFLLSAILTLRPLLTAEQAGLVPAGSSEQIRTIIELECHSLFDLYRHLHADPELSFFLIS